MRPCFPIFLTTQTMVTGKVLLKLKLSLKVFRIIANFEEWVLDLFGYSEF